MTIASTLRILGLGAALVATGLTGAAQAAPAPISPVSYDTTTNVDAWRDDSYSGTVSGFVLSGGLGELTDGVIPTAGFAPAGGVDPYVAWLDVQPSILFDFGANVRLTSVTLYYDDNNGGNSVNVPHQFSLTPTGGATLTQTVINNLPSGEPNSTTLSFGAGLVGQTFTLDIVGSHRFVFISEVAFVGAAVPLPAGLPMLVMGLGAFGLMKRRRKTA